MKLCPKCNYSNQDFDTVCNSCGSPLDSVNESSTYGMNQYDMNNSGSDLNGNNPPMPIKTNGMAIASLVLGIVSIPLDCCCGIGIIPAILALVFGILGKKAIKGSSGTQKGDGMALAGIILGAAGIVLGIGALIYYFIVGASSGQFWDEFRNQLNNEMSNQMNNMNDNNFDQ